jgi:hypothetical protein
VVGPIVADLGQACRNREARILELLTDAQAGMPAFVPPDALVRGKRGLEAVEELVGARPGRASLEIEDVHGRAQ